MQKVSLIIPCYNAQNFLGLCLESVNKQTYPIDEILVINDGSVDNTARVAEQFPVRIINHSENMGLAAARNTAVIEAKNELIAFLDADCMARPDWLEQLMNNVTDKKIAGVGGKLIEKYTLGVANKWRAVHMSQHWGNEIIESPPFLYGSNNVLRKNIVKSVGLYNEKLRNNYEDVDLSMRLYDRGFKLVYNPNAIVEHLRKDTISSVLATYWRWSCYLHINQYNVNSFPRRIVARFLFIVEIFHKFLKQDLGSGNYGLLIINFLLLFYFLWLDLKLRFKKLKKTKK